MRSIPSCFLVGRTMISAILEDRIEETGLGAVDALVIRAIHLNRALSASEIRETLALRPSSVTRVVDRLTELGLVGREGDFEDRRLVIVRPTGPGMTVADMVDNAVRELEREIAEHAGAAIDGVDAVVNAIELIGQRDERLRRRRW